MTGQDPAAPGPQDVGSVALPVGLTPGSAVPLAMTGRALDTIQLPTDSPGGVGGTTEDLSGEGAGRSLPLGRVLVLFGWVVFLCLLGRWRSGRVPALALWSSRRRT